jgi:hypothetical protein
MAMRIVAVMVIWTSAGIVMAAWLGPLSTRSWLAVLGVYYLFLHQISTLWHELGHAVAARKFTRRPVQVIVGRAPRRRMRFGRVIVDLGVLPILGLSCNGLTRYNPAGVRWRLIAWIALSGPAATSILLVVVVVLGRLEWHTGIAFRYLMVFWGVQLAVSLMTNVRPRPLNLPPDAVLRGARDGWLAQWALARAKAGAPPWHAPAREARPRPASVAPPASARSLDQMRLFGEEA